MVAAILQAVSLLGVVGFYTREVFKMINSYYSEQFKEQIIEQIEEGVLNSSEVGGENFCRSSGFLELFGNPVY